jgi:hypothetical protein
MPRILTVSRVTVAPEREAEYLATIQALAELGAGRYQRLWVFRSQQQPHTFLEFSESPSRASHRARASRTAPEMQLEQRLRSLATYAADAWDLWEEIPTKSAPADEVDETGESGGWSPDERE